MTKDPLHIQTSRFRQMTAAENEEWQKKVLAYHAKGYTVAQIGGRLGLRHSAVRRVLAAAPGEPA